jgi:hypothetical protein
VVLIYKNTTQTVVIVETCSGHMSPGNACGAFVLMSCYLWDVSIVISECNHFLVLSTLKTKPVLIEAS